MKYRLLLLTVLLAVSFPLLAQVAVPAPAPANPVQPITVSLTVVATVAQVLGIAKLIQQAINGVKDFVPALANSPATMRIMNFAGNLLGNLTGCFLMGHVYEISDLAKCVLYAIVGALVTAGWFKQNQTNDTARAANSVPELKSAVAADATPKPAVTA